MPPTVQAQTELGQDPFALTPDKLSIFGGSETNSDLNSLFGGTDMSQNGIFTTPSTQLGGAMPYTDLTEPERSNDGGGPTFLMLTSKYSPTGDLTRDSTINLTVTIKNVGTTRATNIKLHATLQDKNAALLDSPPPAPAMNINSSIETELLWDRIANNSISLSAGQSTTFSWSFKANRNDSILRWRFVAEYGSGESVLLQWIPIKNPNPQAGSFSGTPGGGGTYNNPCSTVGGSGAFPDTASGAEIVTKFKQNWNIELVNSGTDFTNGNYHAMLKAWWEVLTTVECTPFLTDALAGQPLQIMGIGGGGGGWWGEYMGGNVQNMWIDNISQGSIPHIKQNLIHELGHVWRGGQPGPYADYENSVCGHGSVHPFVSVYGGTNCSENMAEIVGYYVVRESDEWGVGGAFCQGKNPFDWNQATYYNWAKEKVFNGKEYGSPPPSSGSC